MDVSKIEPKFLKENHLLGMMFPAQGAIFHRITGVETIYYQYDEVGSIAADTQSDPNRLGMAANSIDNVLRVEQCDHVYQVFLGWQPGAIRQYLYYPYETARRNLDVKRISNKSDFGFIKGTESTYDCPSPDTELIIPFKVDVAFAWYNPLAQAETLKLNMCIRRMSTELIRDVDLISRILSGSQPCRLTTIGGITDSFGYAPVPFLDIDFVKLGATKEEIQKAVSPV